MAEFIRLAWGTAIYFLWTAFPLVVGLSAGLIFLLLAPNRRR